MVLRRADQLLQNPRSCRGVLLRPLDNVVYPMLPQIVSEEVLGETVRSLREAILEF